MKMQVDESLKSQHTSWYINLLPHFINLVVIDMVVLLHHTVASNIVVELHGPISS